MSDPRPYVPAHGARLVFHKKVYMLREVDGERVLFNVQGLTEAKRPTYRLEGEDAWHFRVVSLRTGKRTYGGITCFMARVHRDRPLPKFPLWRGD